MRMPKNYKNKGKLNLTVREEQRNRLEQMASLEKRSVSNLIEVMADERWERLVEQQGISYAQTIAGAMNLKLDMDNPADREKLRRAVLDLVAGRKMQSKRAWLLAHDCASQITAVLLRICAELCDNLRLYPRHLHQQQINEARVVQGHFLNAR